MPASAIVFTYATTISGYGAAYLFAAQILASAIDAYIMGSLLAPSEMGANLGQQNLTIRSAADPFKIIYGRQMTGGTLVYADVLDNFYLAPSSTSTRLVEKREKSKNLNIVIALAAHEIDGIEQIYIGEDLVFETETSSGILKLVDTKYKDKISIEAFNGATGQSASTKLIAQVAKHYKGKNASSSENVSYYSEYGVTAITGNSITINSNLVSENITPLSYNYDESSGDGDLTTYTGVYNGTYSLGFDSGNGHTLPASGLPWTTEHKLTNTAYIYLTFKYDPDLYKSGIPKVRTVLRGKKVYDPRVAESAATTAWQTNTTYAVGDKVLVSGTSYKCNRAHTSATNPLYSYFLDFIINNYWEKIHTNVSYGSWQWSDNWALCLRDYLTSGNYHSRPEEPSNYIYGIGVKESQINEANIIEAANIADEIVALNAPAVTINSSSWDAEKSQLTIRLAGDQTEYYAAYENIRLNDSSGSITRVILGVQNGSIALKPAGTIPDGAGISENITLDTLKIYSSDYNVNTDETTLVIKSTTDLTPVTSIVVYSKRFTVNGIINTADSPVSILQNLLAAGGGSMPFAQGKFLLIPGVYNMPATNVTVIDESYIAGDISVSSSLGVADRVNTITGTIKNPSNNWEESDFPKQTHSDYITEDGGYELAKSVAYPFTTSNFDAQRLARVSLLRYRLQVSASIVCNTKALHIPIGSFLKVSLDRLGWDNKEFSVVSWSMDQGKVVLGLREEASNVYTWDSTTLQVRKYPSKTSLSLVPELNPLSNLVAYSGTNALLKLADGTIIPRIKITWDTLNSTTGTKLVLEVIHAATSGIQDRVIELKDYSSGLYYLDNIKEGQKVTIKATVHIDNPNIPQNIPEYTGNTLTIANHLVVGKTEVPTDISNLTSSYSNDYGYSLSWDANTEIDFSHYEIRVGSVDWNTSATVGTTIDASYILGFVATGTLVYRVKAVDTTGNYSANDAIVSITTAAPDTPIVATSITGNILNIFWNDTTTDIPLDYYLVTYDDPATGNTVIDSISSLSASVEITWIGSTTVYVTAYDLAGNASSTGTKTVTIAVPNTPVVTTSIEGSSLVLSWINTPGTLDIAYYGIRYNIGTSTVYDSATRIADSQTNSYTIPIVSTEPRTYLIKAYDVVGNESAVASIVYTPTAPEVLTTPTYFAEGGSITLSWVAPASELPIIEYIIKEGTDWNTATVLTRTKSLTYTLEGWAGSKTFWIAAVDSAMDAMNRSLGVLTNHGQEVSKLITITPPEVVDTSYSFSESNVILSWSIPTTVLPIDYYLLTRGSNRVVVTKQKTTSVSLVPDWLGTEDFYLTIYDIAGGVSAEIHIPVTVAAPGTFTITNIVGETSPNYTISADKVEFVWSAPITGSLPVVSYDIRYDENGTGNYATATKILITSTNGFSRKVEWAGTRKFMLAAIDSSGNYGEVVTIDVIIDLPTTPSILPQVIDNNVLLQWNDSTTTLPIDHYIVKRAEVTGSETYALADLVGNISGIFSIVFETKSSNYKYWVTAVDSAGNLSGNGSITAQVSEPPDYILFANGSDPGFTGSGTNSYTNSAGYLNLPVNTTETFAQHFTSNSWDQPIDQVNAGYPVYIEPTPTTANYIKEWDLGTILTNLSVTANITTNIIDGSIINSADTSVPNRWYLTISTSEDNVSWTVYPANSFKIFSPSFRYIRFRLDVVTTTGEDLLEVTDLAYTIDIKEKSDAGSATASATDTCYVFSGGTTSGTFVAGESIIQAGTNATGIYLWETNDKLYLKHSSGTFNDTGTLSGSGTYTPTSIATTGGTPVVFNKTFVDLSSITATAKKTATYELTAIYDFLDEPNPKGMFIYLYDTGGTRRGGDFSWNVRGH